MLMNRTLIMVVFSMLLVSGCVNFPGFRFGQQGTVVEAPDDVLLIKNVQIVPNPPIPAASSFDLTFLVENTGDAETGKEARNTKIYAFDWGRCRPDPSVEKTSDGQLIGIPGQEPNGVTIFPGGGAVLVEWPFFAPTNEQLGRVQGTCTLRYKVGYNFSAFTITDLSVVDEERLRQANRAGETVEVVPVTSRSKGPLKIDVAIGADQPAREGATVPLNIIVEDRGVGVMRAIPKDALKLVFPAEFAGKITCDPTVWKAAGLTYTNKEELLFIKKKTPPLRCDVVMPDVVDIKTFSLRAEMDYRYEIFSETPVAIKPTAVTVDEGGGDGGEEPGVPDGGGGGDGEPEVPA